ncbi:MAG: restriction endonuclease subunit S [Acetobacter sp.]|nr:restriction endonuclease subunit S [Acetobacter sp.]
MTRQMKDSGIEWIGEIPAVWNIRKIFQVFTQVKNKNQGMVETNLLSLSYGKIKQKNIETSFGLLPESFETYNIIDKNDIVLRLTDLQNDQKSLRVGLSTQRGIITSAYVTMRAKNPRMAPYLYYLLHTFDIEKGFYGMGDGVRQGLNWDELKHLSFVLPSLSEQQKIADYLNEKCGAIEEVIAKTEQSIEEYKKLKQSVITEAVTKGVRPNRKMKDSGIAWIGEIPEDFSLIPLKYIAEYNKQTLPETTNPLYEFDYIDIGSVTYGKGIENVQTMKFKDAPTRARRVVYKDDVILSTVRTYLQATAQIMARSNSIVVSTGFITLTAIKNKVSPTYLKYAIQLDAFISEVESKSEGISYPAINPTEVVMIKAIVPPLSEQKEIADYLDKKCAEIDTLIEKKQKFLTELATYKKSMIYEYVTGKKEVA